MALRSIEWNVLNIAMICRHRRIKKSIFRSALNFDLLGKFHTSFDSILFGGCSGNDVKLEGVGGGVVI